MDEDVVVEDTDVEDDEETNDTNSPRETNSKSAMSLQKKYTSTQMHLPRYPL